MISACDNENIFLPIMTIALPTPTVRMKHFFYFGKYVPESGSGVSFPYIYMAEYTSERIFSVLNGAYGPKTEDDETDHGVSYIYSSRPQTLSYTLSYGLTATINTGTLPATAGSIVNEYPIYILPNDQNAITGSGPNGDTTGILGRLDFVRTIRATDVSNLDRLDTDTKLILSCANNGPSPNPDKRLITIPWISGTLMSTGSSLTKQ